MLRNKAGKLDDCAASRTVVPGYTFPVRDLARTNGTLRLLLSVCFIRGRVRAMHIKNTIPAEFVFNSALMKNIENTLIKQHRTVNNERMITEI
ncbi:TPA: hypothetical protein MI926_14975, partial [Klebsiella pneumoniae]|nr:hypothetical protein [Klebsiella pneumoniae]